MARDRMDVTSFRRQGFLRKTTATSCGRVTGTSYIEPGSPWENPYVESFGSRLRDELLSCEQFTPRGETRRFAESQPHLISSAIQAG